MANISILMRGLTMMTKICLILAAVVGITVTASCANAVRSDGPYEGRIIDAETGRPIEGVVVLGVWYREYPSIAGAMHKYHDAKETVTNAKGEFAISGTGLQILSNIEPVNLLIFKSGYEYESGSWNALKKYTPRIKWEGEKAIIPLRKLTKEERRESMTLPSEPSLEIPPERMTLMMQEIQKERKARGLDIYKFPSRRRI